MPHAALVIIGKLQRVSGSEIDRVSGSDAPKLSLKLTVELVEGESEGVRG